jgi:hypothetical protein
MSQGRHVSLIAKIAAATVVETLGSGGEEGDAVARQHSIPGFVVVVAAPVEVALRAVDTEVVR